jgi:hypothetical protein
VPGGSGAARCKNAHRPAHGEMKTMGEPAVAQPADDELLKPNYQAAFAARSDHRAQLAAAKRSQSDQLPDVETAVLSALAGLTDEARNQRKRMMARQPCAADRAFPRDITMHTYQTWCRRCCKLEKNGKEPLFICWKEGGRWFVDEVTIQAFLAKRRRI